MGPKQKKSFFFSWQSTKAFSPPPPRLSGQKNYYKYKKNIKFCFFLNLKMFFFP